jgi:hypothetical protein
VIALSADVCSYVCTVTEDTLATSYHQAKRSKPTRPWIDNLISRVYHNISRFRLVSVTHGKNQITHGKVIPRVYFPVCTFYLRHMMTKVLLTKTTELTDGQHLLTKMALILVLYIARETHSTKSKNVCVTS